MKRIPTKNLVSNCLTLAFIVTVVVLMVAAVGGAEPQATEMLPVYTFFNTPAGKMAFIPGDQAGTYRMVIADAFWNLAPIGHPTPTPETLTGLARETRDWVMQLVSAEGRAAEAKRLAAGYRAVGERAAKGEFASLVEVQNAQAIENRKALGIAPEDAQAGKTNRWYPVIKKLAEWLKGNSPADAKVMGPICVQIAQGLEAVQ